MSPVSDSKIVFTRAGLEDSSEVLEWIRKYYTYDHIDFDAETLTAAMPELLKNDLNGLAYFVELDNKPVGYFILTYAFDLEFGGRHATVTDLFFEANIRRAGLGTRTLQFIESLCSVQNFSHLLLQVETDNDEAKAFYQKSKFTVLTRHILTKRLGSEST